MAQDNQNMEDQEEQDDTGTKGGQSSYGGGQQSDRDSGMTEEEDLENDLD